MIDTVRGVLRVRKWPRKRGTPKSALQRHWIDWFKQANLLAKYVDPVQQARAIEMTKGSGLYPRDVILSAMRGRLYWWADETGWKWFPMAAILDISKTFDILGQTVGDMFYRATDRWRAIPAGAVDEVLTAQGPGVAPAWLPAAGGGTPFGGCLLWSSATQNVNNKSWKALDWNQEKYDTDNLHDLVTNPDRITVPAGWSKIRLSGGVVWNVNATGRRVAVFRFEGSGFIGEANQTRPADQNSQQTLNSPAIDVAEGDWFQLRVWQDSGSQRQVLANQMNVYFAMERVE